MFCRLHNWRMQRALDACELPTRATARHLARCPACRERWACWQHADAALRAARVPTAAAPGLAARVLARVRLDEDAGCAAPEPHRVAAWRVAAAVAVLAVLAAAALRETLGPTAGTRIPPAAATNVAFLAVVGRAFDALRADLPAADLAEQRLTDEYRLLNADLCTIGAVIFHTAAATLFPGDVPGES